MSFTSVGLSNVLLACIVIVNLVILLLAYQNRSK
jgi:hypothetical protein